jgi:hypothetical protein
MNKIYGAKQVGRVSYFVDNLGILETIIEENRIKKSNGTEVNPRTGQEEYYVSLSRSMTAAAIRNNKRWRYGLILDGDTLSERYAIEPYSFAGNNINNQKGFRIKTLVSYNNGTYVLSMVNWPTIEIDFDTFSYLKNEIESQSDEFNRAHKLEHQVGGKRKVRGALIDEKFNYGVKHGDGGQILKGELPGSVQTQLLKGSGTNEYEERIWCRQYPHINIANSIRGIIVPKKEIPDLETDTDPLLSAIRDLLDERCNGYDIVYY